MEWTVSKTMYRSSTSRKMCVYSPTHPLPPTLPQEKEREKKKSPALPTPFLSLRPLLQPPVAPSHSSYEPRAGRSEYNFLYCVNVRTIRLNKKKKMFILRNAGVWIIAPLTLLAVRSDPSVQVNFGDSFFFKFSLNGNRAPLKQDLKLGSQSMELAK